jgi:signal transduction histidine kinase
MSLPWLLFVPDALAAVLLAVVVPGILVVTVAPALTAAQRWRLRAVAGVDLPPAGGDSRTIRVQGVLTRLRLGATWRQLSYHLLVAPSIAVGGVLTLSMSLAGLVLTTVFAWVWVLPVSNSLRGGVGWSNRDASLTGAGIVLVLVAPWVAALLTNLDLRAGARLLGLSRAKELERRIVVLDESRAGLAEATDAERRRIERDLHDGVQSRLVSLSINLGLARSTLIDLPDDAMRVIADAHDEALQVVVDLRNVVRGMHPAVLDDRGLDAALSGIVARAPLPVTLHVTVAERAPPTVEAVAYFVVSEALANVTKHAQATAADVTVTRLGDMLRVVVSDDGVGGAEPT